MRLIAARIITIGFILGFTHLVTTPVPVLCLHDCGEIQLLGATAHLSHDVSHDIDLDHDHHGHDAEHSDGHGCQHTTTEHPHDDTSCVDVSMSFDILLPSSDEGVEHIAPIVVLANDAPSAAGDARILSLLDNDLASKSPPLLRLGRLLI